MEPPEIGEVKIIKSGGMISFQTKNLDSNLTYGANDFNHYAA